MNESFHISREWVKIHSGREHKWSLSLSENIRAKQKRIDEPKKHYKLALHISLIKK